MTDISLGSMIIEDSGEGPPVVMIHGLGGSSGSFQTLMPSCRGFRVLRFDLPGAGRSRLRPGRPGLPGLAASVRECLQMAGVARAHFVGHSMGTLICQHLAAQTPDLVMCLTLFGPILEPPPAAREALAERAVTARKFGMACIADAVSAASLSAVSKEKNPAIAAFVRESLLRQDPGGYAAHCEALSEADAADHGAIGCPVLLVAGGCDLVAPVPMARRLAEKITGAQLQIIPEAAHWMMLEAPKRSAELLRAHIVQARTKTAGVDGGDHDNG